MLKIAMLSTGEEVLHGDIVDTNAAWLSQQFFENGFGLTKRSTVGDSLSSLVEELLMLSFNNQVVLVNGGLGPTADDLSAAAAAEAAEQKLVLFSEWLTVLERFFAQRQKTMPESNLKQAMLPEKASIIDNPIGTACGFKLAINDCWFYFTPGVPSEFKLMVTQQILPELKQQFAQQTSLDCSRLYTFGSSESALADKLDKLQLPTGYQLGYRSYLPFIEVKLFGPADDLSTRVRVLQLIHSHIDAYVVSIDQPMLEHLGHLLHEKSLSLSIAEQSTKGYLSQWLLSNDQIARLSGHSWILSHKTEIGLTEQDPLAAVLALAAATKEKCLTELALVSGPIQDNMFCLALSTPQGEWAQQLKFNRAYAAQDQRVIIATIAADMLRRYLAAKLIFTDYASASRLKDIHLTSNMLS